MKKFKIVGIIVGFLVIIFLILNHFLFFFTKPGILLNSGRSIDSSDIVEGVQYFESYSIPPPGCKEIWITIAKLKTGELRGNIISGCINQTNNDFLVSETNFQNLMSDAKNLTSTPPSKWPPLMGGDSGSLVVYRNGKKVVSLEQANNNRVASEVIKLVPASVRP